MQVQVRFFTVLREVTSKKEEAVNFPENEKVTVEKVLQALSKRHGKGFVEYVFGTAKEPKGYLQFLVNGKSTTALSGLQTELHDGDLLAIVPPVGGG